MKRFLTPIIVCFLLALSCGKSEESGSVTKPTTPTGLELKRATETSLTYQWDQVKGAEGYDWRLLLGSDVVQSGVATSRNVTISNLSAATTYKFAVRSFIGDETSSYCSYVEGTTSGSGSDNPDTPDTPSSELSSYYSMFEIPASEEDGVARAFPGAEGGGMYTTGGRGGTVYHVTNLNDSGEGSLRWAVSKSGPRIIVFDVAGIIELESDLNIKNGDLTIAGQTAPGDGICLKNYSTVIKEGADNVIIRFIRFRLGDEAGWSADDIKNGEADGEDCIWGRYLNNIIIDHCSMSWSIDECASFYANVNMTMQWCIIAESMANCRLHSKGTHGYGGIWGGKNTSFHHNLLAHHTNRTPRFDHQYLYDGKSKSTDTYRGNVDYRNCVNYNYGSGNGAYGGEGGWFNLVNNYYKPGPNSATRNYYIEADSYYSSKNIVYGYPQLYLSGNYSELFGSYSSAYSDGVLWKNLGSTYNSTTLTNDGCLLSSALTITGADGTTAYTTTHSASEAYNAVLDYAGASLSRDKVDARITADVEAGTGKIIDDIASVTSAYGYSWPTYEATSEELSNAKDTDGDGIPDWFEDKYGLDKNDASDAAEYGYDASKRYTNLEMYLHYLVKDITTAQIKNGTYTKL